MTLKRPELCASRTMSNSSPPTHGLGSLTSGWRPSLLKCWLGGGSNSSLRHYLLSVYTVLTGFLPRIPASVSIIHLHIHPPYIIHPPSTKCHPPTSSLPSTQCRPLNSPSPFIQTHPPTHSSTFLNLASFTRA
ncbi:hypothetical protein Pmani_032763 [Petrolisthes manimaculis]|uniref:Uncharacterized protein n=1 Tax=Petrolisthes manimaculis TaxID=1843537 RepID=A0AAE1NR67_9EUCA|nr:hypothetical protein Pmani_032763 [Petrolisthes manimaculis]